MNIKNFIRQITAQITKQQNPETNETNETNETISLALKVRDDREFRQKLRAGDSDALAQLGISESPYIGISPEIKVITSTRDVTYIQMPYRLWPSQTVDEEQLDQIRGGIGSGYLANRITSGSASSWGNPVQTEKFNENKRNSKKS